MKSFGFISLSEDLSDLNHRFIDLAQIIRDHYYHPSFHGSFSLKSVLPVIVPEMNYDDLEIQEGSVASIEYLKMLDPETATEERQIIRNNLLDYCNQDTLAMVKIVDRLCRKN